MKRPSETVSANSAGGALDAGGVGRAGSISIAPVDCDLAHSSLSIIGGDIAGCIDSEEIDDFLRDDDAPHRNPSSALLFRLRHGLIPAGTVKEAIERCTVDGHVFFVGHFRHHWVALHLSPSSLRVFDSAPSPPVCRDIARLAARLNWPAPLFLPAPRQTRGSEECGLFALAAVCLLRDRQVDTLPSGTFSLEHLRSILAEPGTTAQERVARREHFATAAATAYALVSPTIHCADCGIDIALDHPNQADNTRRTHATSKAHLRAIAASRRSSGVVRGGLAPQRCSASTQAKRGGHQCASKVVSQGLCRMHLLLMNIGDDMCSASSKAGRPCCHRAVRGLGRCPFHVDDLDFTAWLASHPTELDQQPAASPLAPPPVDEPVPADIAHATPVAPPAATEVPRPTPAAPPLANPFLEAVRQVDDPDLEDEIFETIDPWDFPQDQPPPSIPPLPLTASFSAFRAFLRQRGPTSHPLASLAWRRTTLLGHARIVRALLEPNPAFARLLGAPLVPALLEIVSVRRRSQQWRWTSTLRHMAEIAGALRNLPISSGIPAVELSTDPQWVAAMRGVAGHARAERPRTPKAATAEQIRMTMAAEPNMEVRRLLALTWLCCGRTGDCRQLQPEDLSLVGNDLTVTFRRGKTIQRRGPFSLHTTFPPGWRQLLAIPDGDVSWAASLSRASVSDVLIALRRVDKHLENRSIRRGALQSLAAAGAPEDLLLLFSGHTSVDTLRRYLAWGAIGSAKKTAMTPAAAALAPTGAGSHRVHDPYAKVTSVTPKTKPSNPPSYDEAMATARDPERWIQFLGQEPPPIEALPLLQPLGDPDELPLMSKAVAGVIDIPLVRGVVASALAQDESLAPHLLGWAKQIPVGLAELATESLRWLHDARRYEELRMAMSAPSRLRKHASCHLPPEDFEMQQMLQKYEAAERMEDRAGGESGILAWCRIFAVPEWHKDPPRRRHIAEPLINDWFAETPTIHFRSRQDRHQIIRGFGGGYAATLDLASFFDQIGLAEAVRPFFGVRYGDRASRMRVLPMGFRPSAQIAQVIAWLLTAGFDSSSARVLTYIDNFLILATTAEEVTRIRSELLARAAMIGAVFNSEGLDAAPTQQFEFLGEAFDLSAAPAVSLSKKTRQKLDMLGEGFTGKVVTRRHLAAVVGLFLFASGAGLLDNKVYRWYQALRYYRREISFPCSTATLNPWGQRCGPMNGNEAATFEAWLIELRRNEPRVINADDEAGVTDVMFVDACDSGWGVVHLRSDGRLEAFETRWSAQDHASWNLLSSVASEPLAISRALCRCIRPAPGTHAVVYTDHEPVVVSVPSLCAKAYSYWVLQSAVRDLTSRSCVRITLRHIAGIQNPADGLSRGESQNDDGWRLLLGEALTLHASQEESAARSRKAKEEAYGEPEWVSTARNPVRALRCGAANEWSCR